MPRCPVPLACQLGGYRCKMQHMGGVGRRQDAGALNCLVPPPLPFPSLLLQERLAAADSQQAELEFELGDKSASLQEAREQAEELKRRLADAQSQQGSAAEREAALQADLEAQRLEAEGSRVEVDGVAAQLGALQLRVEQQQGVLVEKEQQVGAGARA